MSRLVYFGLIRKLYFWEFILGVRIVFYIKKSSGGLCCGWLFCLKFGRGGLVWFMEVSVDFSLKLRFALSGRGGLYRVLYLLLNLVIVLRQNTGVKRVRILSRRNDGFLSVYGFVFITVASSCFRMVLFKFGSLDVCCKRVVVTLSGNFIRQWLVCLF